MDEQQSDVDFDEELPDTSGYSSDCNLLPWKSLEYEKQLRVVCGDRKKAIKHAINWVYSSGEFPQNTDMYAAGAWAVLAHGLVCTYDGLPTSNWIYERPTEWKVTSSEMDERINRAFLKFPVATELVVMSKAFWWLYDDSLGHMFTNTCLSLYEKVADTIAQWASTRKVLSLAGVKGVVAERELFGNVPQRLRIADYLKPYFLHPPMSHSNVEALFNPCLLPLIKYWPDTSEIHSVLDQLKAFNANGARYHSQSEFLTGKPRERMKLESFNEKMAAIEDVLNEPSSTEAESCAELLNEFNKGFVKQLAASYRAGRMNEFLAKQTPSVTDDVIEAITEQVNMMRIM